MSKKNSSGEKNVEYPYGKNVFLTGGSSGIGLAAAEKLAENGFTVFAGSRRPSMPIRTFPGGGSIVPITLDVCDPDSVTRAVADVLAQVDIGIVVHCAGTGAAAAAETMPEHEIITRLFNTNYIGVLSVNSHILPHLRRRGGGLCIAIGSVAGVFSIPYQSHYSATKAALEAYIKALRLEAKPHGVKASLVLPGDTATGFTDSRSWLTGEDSVYYRDCCRATLRMEKDERNGRPPSSAAKVILKLCCKKSPPVHKTVGLDYKLLVFLRRVLPERVVEFVLRRMYLKG